MKTSNRTYIQAIIVALALLMLAACGGSSSDSTATGKLSLSLTDATPYQYQAVYVTIDGVSVHMGSTATGGTSATMPSDDSDNDGWKTLETTPQTVNLLELVNAVLLGLGQTDLEAGHYTQLRLHIGNKAYSDGTVDHPYANYVIDEAGDTHKLKVPSNKIKLVRGFDIHAGEETELILDFDAAKSVVKAGMSGHWLLKPTIKVLNGHQHAMINGTVKEDTLELLPIAEALVSAQLTWDTGDEAERIMSAAATTTEETGEFALLIEPGTYNLVAFAEGYEPACATGETMVEMGWTEDFLLAASGPVATLTGTLSITNGEIEQPVAISVRQQLPCPAESELVEIVSDQVANGGIYSFNLPAGTYDVVVSTTGEDTILRTVTLDEGLTTTEDFAF